MRAAWAISVLILTFCKIADFRRQGIDDPILQLLITVRSRNAVAKLSGGRASVVRPGHHEME